MARVEQAGKYSGRVLSTTIQVKKDGEVVSSASLVAALELYERFSTGSKEWEALPEPATITAYLNLIKNDGSRNDTQWNSLEKALGWNGDPRLLMKSDRFAGKEVQVTVEQNEYQGKVSLKVAWINPVGGGVVKEAAKDEQDLFIELCAKAGVKISETPIEEPEDVTPF